jgi:hypothetical protein
VFVVELLVLSMFVEALIRRNSVLEILIEGWLAVYLVVAE